MGRLNATYALRAGMFGHVYVDDHEVGRAIERGAAWHAKMHAIACFAEPLLKQTAREVIFLVYHNVHCIPFSQHGAPYRDKPLGDSPRCTSPGNVALPRVRFN